MKNAIYYVLLFYAAICALSIAYFDGTGDSGDSITHYLFARYAPVHPVLYFDHWAKPLFVLLASPFAQAGFIGMKVFNSLIALGIIFMTFKTAAAMNIRNAIMAPVLLIFSPLFYILTFSGLTEYLFALFTITAVFFCARQKYLYACLVISFLPYVRSEGLIIMGVFGLFFLVERRFRYLPWLLCGSLVYALTGYFVHKDLLWVFTKIPYARLSSVYGQGGLFHFVSELINITGVPAYALFWIGVLTLLYALVKKKFSSLNHLLLLAGFFAFFVAHSLFWYLGIFNSMGLKRVFIGITPLIALIALQGFNVITENLLPQRPKARKVITILLIAYLLIFPFTVNPAAIHWEKDMNLNADQKLAIRIAGFLKQEKRTPGPLIYNYRYLSLPLEMDYFDDTACRQMSWENIAGMQPGQIVIWDNLYGEFESGIKKAQLDSSTSLQNIFVYEHRAGGTEILFSGYEKK